MTKSISEYSEQEVVAEYIRLHAENRCLRQDMVQVSRKIEIAILEKKDLSTHISENEMELISLKNRWNELKKQEFIDRCRI